MVIAEPPFEPAVKATLSCWSPGVMPVMVGAAGAVAPVAVIEKSSIARPWV